MVIKYDKPECCYACGFINNNGKHSSCNLCKPTINAVGGYNLQKKRASVCPFDHPENARHGFCIQDCETVSDYVVYVDPSVDPIFASEAEDFHAQVKHDLALRLVRKMMNSGVITFSTNGVNPKYQTQKISASVDVIVGSEL